MKLIRGFSYYDFFIRSAEVLVYGDVRIQFYNDKKLAFHCWFNTYFVDRSGVFYINKVNIDNAHKDKKNLIFDKNFSLKVFMTKMDGQIGYKNVECKFFNPKKKKLKAKQKQAMTSEEESMEIESSDEEKKDGPTEFSETHSKLKSDFGSSSVKSSKDGTSLVRMPFRQNTEYEQVLLNIANQMPKRKIKFDL